MLFWYLDKAIQYIGEIEAIINSGEIEAMIKGGSKG